MLDRTKAPEAHLLDELALAEPSVSKLDNAVEVHGFRDETNPVIKFDIFFPIGKVHESKAGIANICGKLISEATLSYSSELLQDTLDHYGAHLDVSVDFDETTISLLCLKEHANLLLPVVKSIVTEPLFDAADFDKIKYQLIQRIRINNGKNNVLATKAIRTQLLAGSPYAKFASEESINSISLKEVKDFFNTYFKVQPTIVIAGQVDEQVLGKTNTLFGILNFNTLKELPKFALDSNFETSEIKREGSVQASIRLACLSIGKSHPDYFTLSIANEILGGYFGSRLMKNIREEKGYTYGIYSSIINYKNVDYQVIGADVQLANVDDAIKECKKELQFMQTSVVSDNELLTVKNYMLGKLATNLDNIFSQADNYKAKLVEGVNFQEYFSLYVNAIRNVSSEEILKVSRKYFSKEFSIVKVI